MKISKRSTAALCGLVAVALVGSSFAYWNQTSTVENPFDTGKYGSTLTEDFKPSEGTDWQPGVKVNKKVSAVNTGDQDLIIRVRMDETWTRKGETSPFKDSKTEPYNLYTTSQTNATDGLTNGDASVVTKNFGSGSNWVAGSDGWYYYRVNLAGGQTSDNWLESVQLLSDADMGKMETKYYISTDVTVTASTNWVDYTAWRAANGNVVPAYYNPSTGAFSMDSGAGFVEVLHNRATTDYQASGSTMLYGYSNADYVLKITIQSVQATSEAVNAVFGGGSAFTAPAGCAWTLK